MTVADTTGRKKSIRFPVLLMLALLAGPFVSCTPGSRLNQETPGAPAAERPDSRKENAARTVDVTNYYQRPERSDTRSGRGMATFSTGNFVGASRCAVCHELLTDNKGNDMSISGHWRSTMMANAAQDPLWQAKVS